MRENKSHLVVVEDLVRQQNISIKSEVSSMKNIFEKNSLSLSDLANSVKHKNSEMAGTLKVHNQNMSEITGSLKQQKSEMSRVVRSIEKQDSKISVFTDSA